MRSPPPFGLLLKKKFSHHFISITPSNPFFHGVQHPRIGEPSKLIRFSIKFFFQKVEITQVEADYWRKLQRHSVPPTLPARVSRFPLPASRILAVAYVSADKRWRGRRGPSVATGRSYGEDTLSALFPANHSQRAFIFLSFRTPFHFITLSTYALRTFLYTFIYLYIYIYGHFLCLFKIKYPLLLAGFYLLKKSKESGEKVSPKF